ncbi:hydrogenase subunit MbhD domain-containing protein [Pseudohongiella spirulinae]|uniref:Sodium:proton antiporter n=1 Tax=Pseudohongiella spirulinae TaxID=1249552 RepID=A0A0S2K9S2_9GAMM|nr:hydrogenase subunit MbhD domain-containing protein [Pseudohongiella spirulinae]ALO45034.1 sodium:proton antiporter [Pseudohongiella spirulinae]
MTPELLIDLILALLLLIIAWSALFAPSRNDAMAMFIAFGVAVALIWARLGAPDLALAEAAIGAGLTGVLFLNAARQLPESGRTTTPRKSTIKAAVFVLLSVSLFFLMLTGPVGEQLTSPVSDTRIVEAMPDAGVSYPVTAVLLNFRAWDTLLELLVLLLALSGARQLYTSSHISKAPQVAAWPLLTGWTQILAPLLVIIGGYLLWSGSKAPGGAFQAGALIASAAVTLRIVGILPPLRWSFWLTRAVISVGAIVFLMVAIATSLFAEGWLNYPVELSAGIIITIEIFATLSIALTLALLIVGDHEDLRT